MKINTPSSPSIIRGMDHDDHDVTRRNAPSLLTKPFRQAVTCPTKGGLNRAKFSVLMMHKPPTSSPRNTSRNTNNKSPSSPPRRQWKLMREAAAGVPSILQAPKLDEDDESKQASTASPSRSLSPTRRPWKIVSPLGHSTIVPKPPIVHQHDSEHTPPAHRRENGTPPRRTTAQTVTARSRSKSPARQWRLMRKIVHTHPDDETALESSLASPAVESTSNATMSHPTKDFVEAMSCSMPSILQSLEANESTDNEKRARPPRPIPTTQSTTTSPSKCESPSCSIRAQWELLGRSMPSLSPLELEKDRDNGPAATRPDPSNKASATMIVTTQLALETGLGKVVDLVAATTRQDKLPYDLRPMWNQICHPRDNGEAMRLSRRQLEDVLNHVVKSAEDSARKGTKKPTGMHLSNIENSRKCVELRWGRKRKVLQPSE